MHTFDLFEALLVESTNLGVFLFQALKALCEWVGNLQAVFSVRNIAT